jgi:hypothetical protein
MRPTSKSPYRGTLVRPINYETYVSTNGSGGSAIDLTIALSGKLSALCRYYGVEPTEINREHVLILAGRYVPGFQIGRVKRARRKWDDVRLAQLWMYFRSVRRECSNDESAIGIILMHQDFQWILANLKPVWIKQLLDKARLSPLVQMLESSNPCDNDFAQKFLSKHSRKGEF